MKTAIIVDSLGYLSPELKSHPDIYSIKLSVNFHDGSNMWDSSEPEEATAFYDRLAKEKQLPTTSQPQVGEYYALMDELIAKGYDVVLGIHASSGISGTYQTAHMVLQEYSDKVQTFAIDSKGAAVVMEGLVKATLQLLAQNEDITSIVDKLTWLANHSRIYLMVEDLTNLVKGGRLSATSALLGGVLQIRPLLYFDEEGKIVLFEKIRTNKKVYKRWVELVTEAQKQYPKGIDVSLAHADALDEVEEIIEFIQETHPELDIWHSLIGAVVGTHTGRGAKGMAIMPLLDNYPH